MKNTHKTKNITCRIVSTGTVMQVNTIDEILSPGQYKIDACGVTTSDGFPDGVEGECLSAYLEVSDTNHSADNLKSAAVGQTLTYTDADGDTAVYHRSGTNKDGKVEWSAWSNTAALGLQNGSITSEKLSSDIRKKIETPLRPLFIAAGAEYNDTGADITKTAPWGESVTHKAGHYYLNGLGDITEEEMIEIYNAGMLKMFSTDQYSYYKVRTNIPMVHDSGMGLHAPNMTGMANGNKNIECFMLSTGKKTHGWSVQNLYKSFASCSKLKYIPCPFNVTSITSGINIEAFTGCTNLREVYIYNLKTNLTLSDASNIYKKCIVDIIQKATPTTAITIKLHPSAYLRLIEDIDIITALETQPLISLVSA